VIDRRYTEGRRERLPALAAELVGLNPDVMLVTTGYQAAALKHATTAIPIVAMGGDLVAEGLAASLARPGGNVIGLQLLQPDAAAKRVSLLKETMPRISKVGLLFGAVGQWFYDGVSRDCLRSAAQGPGGCRVGHDGRVYTRESERVIDLAVRYHLPAMCDVKNLRG
jgi:hypothetical protein